MKQVVTGKAHNFFLILMIIVVGLAAYMLRPFFSAIIMALIISMMFTPLYQWFLGKFRGRVGLANSFSIITIILSFLIPIIIMGYVATAQFDDLKSDFDGIVADNDVTVELITEKVNIAAENIPGVDKVTEDEVIDYINKGFSALSKEFFDRVLSLGATSVEITIQTFVFLFMLAFMLPNMKNIKEFCTDLSPLDDELDKMYIERVATITDSMVKGTFIIALLQTVLSVIFLAMAGVGYLLLLSIVLLLSAVIPMVGTMIVVVPIGVIMIIAGEVNWGIFLIITNILVVNSVDNIVRPMLVSGKTSMNSALILVSILGGVRMMGPFGFIYGPVVMILAMTTVEVYKKFYRIK